jgi:HSF-type DNA-binding
MMPALPAISFPPSIRLNNLVLPEKRVKRTKKKMPRFFDTTTATTAETSFPVCVHRMLTAVAVQGLDYIVSWNADGRTFKIHNNSQFETMVLPQFFCKQKRYRSFQRQLNFYAFARHTSGPLEGSYGHPCFVRDQEALTYHIKRIPKGISSLNTNNNNVATSGVTARNSLLSFATAATATPMSSPLAKMSGRIVSIDSSDNNNNKNNNSINNHHHHHNIFGKSSVIWDITSDDAFLTEFPPELEPLPLPPSSSSSSPPSLPQRETTSTDAGCRSNTTTTTTALSLLMVRPVLHLLAPPDFLEECETKEME